MKRIANALDKLNGEKMAYAVFVLCTSAAIALPAQTFTTLYTFCSQSRCADGLGPYAALVQGASGDGYGTTEFGGTGTGCAVLSSFGCGTVFKITPGGRLTTLHSFCSQAGCPDGLQPWAGLVQATDGDFYGTTREGGAYPGPIGDGGGTVFKITPSGTLTTVYSFCSQFVNHFCVDGGNPWAGLIQATDGYLYGTTTNGGPNNGGTVFKITPSGTLTTLYNFCSQPNCTDGGGPIGLTQATDGHLYGTTSVGGAYYEGTVFKITTSGTLTTLYSFCSQRGCPDGSFPYGTLVQATDGDFYGTTLTGGASNCQPTSCGTVFKITPSGTLTTLYSFSGTDGANPYGGLIQATNGDFYGTTTAGGISGCSSGDEDGCGTIFKITPSGTLTTLHLFCLMGEPCTDGTYPNGGLVQATNGTFYGTTLNGATARGSGTIFSLSVGLGSFVEPEPTSGAVGAPVNILGSDLTGATSLTFDGTAATFTVVSGTLITTTVPAGATTGKVQVVTPGGTLSSNVPFRVRP
jgi:uncharacterized repeat protein (TIGR03803 family)